jgi:hypothetical protein
MPLQVENTPFGHSWVEKKQQTTLKHLDIKVNQSGRPQQWDADSFAVKRTAAEAPRPKCVSL